MQIIEKKLKDLKPYENNPRNNDEAVEPVANSIKEFGFKVPIVIDKNDVIVCGHTRYKASQKLGLEVVPCIIADDLSDEQIKAFRLADNRTSELANWDFDLLDDELENIFDIDMESLGFNLNIFDTDLGIKDESQLDNHEKDNERIRTIEAYNLDLFDYTSTDGFYDMPIIYKEDVIPTDLIGFNYMLTINNTDTGIHMFVDDYQFERVWNNPYKYIDRMKEFQCVLSPDFSLYLDMPIAMKVWNIYRSRLIGHYMQSQGVHVIPTISWAEEETFNFCFDGIEEGCTVAISTIGVKQNEYSMEIWKAGIAKMIEVIKPKCILCYGGDIGYEFPEDIKVIYYENKVTERMKICYNSEKED